MWERLCLAVAKVLYRDVIYHPVLPNGQIPDYVPLLRGVEVETGWPSRPHVRYAPVIIDAKFSISSARKELVDYGPYCDRLEIWFFRWRPNWLDRRAPRVTYRSAYDLAAQVQRTGNESLATFLRRLPLLWGFYGMVALYAYGDKIHSRLTADSTTWEPRIWFPGSGKTER